MTTAELRIRKTPRRRAYTLVEMMIALSIFAFASTAISTLMFASYNTNRHVKGMADSTSQAELTMRRIIELARSAIDLQYVVNASGVFNPAGGLSIKTPADASGIPYIFTYYVKNGDLYEKIQTAALTDVQDLVVISNIKEFKVERVGDTFPRVHNIEVELHATPVPIMRRVSITCRNPF